MADIPISNALAEAEPMSLQELFSRDPEKLTLQNLDLIISELRELREKMEASPTGRIRQARPKTTRENQFSNVNPEDLGI